MSNTRLAAALAAAALLTGAAGPAGAQMLELRPVQLQFGAAHPVQAFTVVNRAAQPATVQVRAFRWSQAAAGQDQLTPAPEVAISPPFIQLAPGESQVVRVRWTGAAGRSETSYRLLVDQLPPPRTGGGVRTALRLSVPAFVAPATRGEADVAVEWALSPDGARTVTVTNRGPVHALIADVPVSTPQGEAIQLPRQGSAYLLSGVSRTWRLDPLPGNARLQVAGEP